MGRPAQRGQMWPRGKSQDHHSTVAYLFFFFPTHTHGSAHTFQWNILRCTTIKGEKVNPQLENGGYLQPSQMVLFTFYKDLCL